MKYDITISDFIGLGNGSPNYIKWRLSEMKDQEVHLNVCSLGGYLHCGLNIYEAIKQHGNVHVTFTAMSASAATILAMGAKSVKAEKHSLILIHNASFEILQWSQMNKEELDKYIEDLKKDRKQLATFDDVIADVYAERSGKDVGLIKEAMNKADWLKAEDALELGLVDSIVEDTKADARQAVNAFMLAGGVTNDLLKQLGLPPVPGQNTENKKEEKPSLLERFAAAITGLNKNKPADTGETTDMKTNFIAVALVLAMEALALGKEEKFELSHDQMQQLEDALNAKDTEIKNLKEQLAQKGGEGGEAENDAEKRLKALEEQLATMKTQLEEKSQQIENLKKAPGAVEQQLQHMTEAEGMDFLDCFK